MKRAFLTLACVTLVASCSTNSNSRSGTADIIGSSSGDLRLLLHSDCAAAKIPGRSGGEDGGPPVRSFPLLAENVLQKVGTLAFKSFGQYLEESGKEKTTRSYGVNGGVFYSAPNAGSEVTIEPGVRCLTVIRNGYRPGSEIDAQGHPAKLRQRWSDLQLTRVPDLYAELHLETSGETGGQVQAADLSDTSGLVVDARAAGLDSFFDNEDGETSEAETSEGEDDVASVESRAETGQRPVFAGVGFEGPFSLKNAAINPPFFRIVLDELFIGEFQDSRSTKGERDLAFVFNYSLGRSQASIATSGNTPGFTSLDQAFATGAIRLPGAVRGGYYSEGLVLGLQTAWMAMPSTKPFDARSTIDVGIYAVEYDEGNQMLEDIGNFLASDEVVNSFSSSLGAEIDFDGSNKQASIVAKYEQIGTENNLIRDLRQKKLLLDATVKARKEKSELISAMDSAEDALLEVEKQKAKAGWLQSEKLSEVSETKELLKRARELL